MSKLTLSGWEEKNEDAAPGGNVIRDRLTSTRTPGRLISPSPLASLCRLWKQCLSAATLLSVLVINSLAEGNLLSLYGVPSPQRT